jgi:L-Ala-D/L-Glu epimerase
LKIKIQFSPETLIFRKPFVLAHGVRNETPCLKIRIYHASGAVGLGESALPPYLNLNPVSAIEEIQKNLSDEELFFDQVEKSAPDFGKIQGLNLPNPVKAGLEMALTDLWGKVHQRSARQLFFQEPINPLPSSFTITSSLLDYPFNPDALALFPLIKVKLGTVRDKEFITQIVKNIEVPVAIDANGGWQTTEEVFQVIDWLGEKHPVYIEQPFPPGKEWLNQDLLKNLSVPIVGDESIKTQDDYMKLGDYFSGINIKLMKCGGIKPALELIRVAKEDGKFTLTGCMSESSCGIAAALIPASLCDSCDLDGPLLISNDGYEGVAYEKGSVKLKNPDAAGLGIREKQK